MKVNAFTPLFQPVTPISKVKFKKSDTGAGPEEPKKVSKYVVHMSKLLVYDYEVMATSRADAERKATTYLNAHEREIEAKAKIDTWQIDDVLSPEGVRMRSYL
jgi:hypothetical protein